MRHDWDMQILRGRWWLPADRENAQPGTLTISDQGDITLDLVGGFDLSIRTPLKTGGLAVSADERPMPLIHGRANNQDITLQEAWTRKSTTYGFGFSNRPDFHSLGANRAFIGTHIKPDEPAVWQGAWVQLENLVTWLGTESIRQSAEIQRESAQFAAVPDQSVVVQDWTYTAVKRHGGFNFDLRRGDASVVGMTSTRLRIDAPSPCTIETLDEHVKAFMDLLTLAAGTACGVISMSVIPAQAPTSADSRPQASNDIPTYVRHIHQAAPLAPAPAPHEWRFTCDDTPFEDLVSKRIPM